MTSSTVKRIALLTAWLAAVVAGPIAGPLAAPSAQAATWYAQNPSNPPGYCYDVDFVDANRGWAVGQGGYVYVTGDGGVNWAAQGQAAEDGLRSIDFVDADHGWGVGWNGTIAATTDGGRSWTRQSTPIGDRELWSVNFVDDQYGWAVGEDAVVSTTDGGLTWMSVGTDGVSDLFMGVNFVDHQRGFLLGFSDTTGVLATTDGGATWQRQLTRAHGGYFGMTFVDERRGWVVGIEGTVYATTDAGTHWRRQDSGTTTDLFSVAFADGRRGWIGSESDDLLLATTDGGAHWVRQAQDQAAGWGSMKVTCVGRSRAWASGLHILRTTDAGSKWTNSSRGVTRLRLTDVTFPDAQHGWAVGEQYLAGDSRNVALSTSDSGAHWAAIDVQSLLEPTLVDFVDAQHGWMANGVFVFGTTNGGLTWLDRSPAGADGIRDIDFIDQQHGWVVGGVLNDPMIMGTTDGGEHWTDQTNPAAWELGSVCFVDATHGWAAGGDSYHYRTILSTTDGGEHWATQVAETWLGRVRALDFADTEHGWAVAEKELLITTDGGLHWDSCAAPAKQEISALVFRDALNGRAVGSGGTILATTDGGTSWSEEESGTGQGLTGLACVDEDHWWVVGWGGTILSTIDTPTPDTTSPVTADNSDGSWHRRAVTVTLTVEDNPDGSGMWGGVSRIEYEHDDSGVWCEGMLVTVTAPSDHFGDGLHTIAYRSTDAAGNVEAERSTVVRIDTTRPRPRAPRAASARRGSIASVRYRVSDIDGVTADVTIKVRTLTGRTLWTLRRSARPVNQLLIARFRCRLPRGTYRFSVYATDAAGNRQSKVAVNRLVVR